MNSFRLSIRSSYFQGEQGWCLGSSSNFCQLSGFLLGFRSGNPNAFLRSIFIIISSNIIGRHHKAGGRAIAK